MTLGLEYQTSLSIDKWAELMGIPPLEFNGLDIEACPGIEYDKVNCSEFWAYHQYNSNAYFSKSQLSFFVFNAEQSIEAFLGYHVAPKWAFNELHTVKKPYNNIDLNSIKFITNWKNVIDGGSPVLTTLGEFNILYIDEDGDGFNEVGLIEIILPEDIELNFSYPNRFRLFAPGHFGEDAYELKEIISMVPGTDPNTYIAKINIWNLVKPELYVTKGFAVQRALSACQIDYYLETIELGFEIVDKCKPNATLIWSNTNRPCIDGDCVEKTMPACIKWIDKCEGIFTVQPVIVDDETGCIKSVVSGICDNSGLPDSIRVNYISGCHNRENYTYPPLIGQSSCPELTRAILALSTTYIGGITCACKCIQDQIIYYNVDLGMQGSGIPTYRYSDYMVSNPFGSAKRGAIEAYKIIENTMNISDLCYRHW